MEKILKYENNDLVTVIEAKIQIASHNAIFRSRLNYLDEELRKGRNQSPLSDEEIEKEIIDSSVFVNNLVEFREVLRQIAIICGESEIWIEDTLAHENAHANEAEVQGLDFRGYIALFVKDEFGKITGIQPACIIRTPKSFSHSDLLKSNEEVTLAPEKYGNELSDYDRKDLSI